MTNDFLKYAVSQGLNSMHVENVMSRSMDSTRASYGYISPTILEERQLNVTQMDVFSRLMMDRVIFLGTEINDYTANVIQAQLLYLDSVDSDRDINL
jgi:ATP-dependent Clp protease protease subunit